MIKLRNVFTIPAPIDEAWKVLLDIDRVATCMPGAKLETTNGDEFEGSVKVKLGAMVLTYRGTAKIVQQDEATHRAVIEGSARETRGTGTASVTIIMSLEPQGGDATEVAVVTELNVTGKPAQFGRGVMADVAERLIDQFSERLREEITAGEVSKPVVAASGAAATPPSDAQPPSRPLRQAYESDDEPIDMLAVAGMPVVKRAAGAAAALVALLFLVRATGDRKPSLQGRAVLARGATILCSCGHESRLV